MVLSKLDSSISYRELKRVEPADEKMEAELYEIDVKEIAIVIAVGKPNNMYEDNNITFFPIYLVKTNNRVTQIGVYEILSTDLTNYMDEDGSLLVENMDEPLIYTFVTKQMLENMRLVPEKEEEPSKEEEGEQEEKGDSDSDSDKEEDKKEKEKEKKEKDKKEKDKKEKEKEEEKEGVPEEIPLMRKDIFTSVKNVAIPALLPEETKEKALSRREKYKKTKKDTDTWLETFMKNNNYSILDNEGGGDCLFATIRDAFLQIGQQTTVQKLRRKLSNEATQDIFMRYKEQYDNFNMSIVNDTKEIARLELEYNKIKQILEQTLDREKKVELVTSAKKIADQRKRIIKEKAISKSNLQEYKFMKNVDTLEKFQKIITTCEFWAETWAISTLERILNIKFVLLSREAYTSGEHLHVLNTNVMTCGNLNDTILESRGVFNPDYYIMVEYNGYHYKLVKYKKKGIFKFQELPYDIKVLVSDKCLESNGAYFALIPEFVEFKKEIQKTRPAVVPKFEVLSEASIRGLYDENIIFAFYKDSASKKLPGKGPGETIPEDRVLLFSELAAIQDWRKKLDMNWVNPFSLDGHGWNSVAHYYYGSRFRNKSPEFYLSFTQESGSDISKDPDMAKAAASSSGNYKGVLIRPKEAKVDPDWETTKRKDKELFNATAAKFSQDPELKDLLSHTRNAKLVHYKKGREPELMETLMIVREKLKAK